MKEDGGEIEGEEKSKAYLDFRGYIGRPGIQEIICHHREPLLGKCLVGLWEYSCCRSSRVIDQIGVYQVNLEKPGKATGTRLQQVRAAMWAAFSKAIGAKLPML